MDVQVAAVLATQSNYHNKKRIAPLNFTIGFWAKTVQSLLIFIPSLIHVICKLAVHTFEKSIKPF